MGLNKGIYKEEGVVISPLAIKVAVLKTPSSFKNLYRFLSII
jgi:hypothetical protein